MTTDEQINRDIAEWCGFKWQCNFNGENLYQYGNTRGLSLPNFLDEIQGLGLLFKYAMPKLNYPRVILFETPTNKYRCNISYLEKGLAEVSGISDTPTRALALAIHKLIKGDNNDW